MTTIIKDELERKDDKNFYSLHWIIIRQIKRLRNPTWVKSYPSQANREHPEWWSRYFTYYQFDKTHQFARVSFSKIPGGKQIITI
jgi:hypothetical protein